jgi:hypothetical protein
MVSTGNCVLFRGSKGMNRIYEVTGTLICIVSNVITESPFQLFVCIYLLLSVPCLSSWDREGVFLRAYCR